MTNQYDDENGIERVLVALQALSNFQCPPATLPPQMLWPKTRHIADLCGMSIYASRRYLMMLVENGKAYMSNRPINNSLRWYIAVSESFPCEIETK